MSRIPTTIPVIQCIGLVSQSKRQMNVHFGLDNCAFIEFKAAVTIYCKFGKDCVSLIFAFFALSLRRKVKIRND